MAKNEVTASELKAHCAQVIDRVVRKRERIIITKRGRPVAQLTSIEEAPARVFGFARGVITIHGDIVAPIDVEWEAAR
jgi:prevent-host-death family protein